MTPAALALVLLSTITHALWNFLLKRAGGSQIFVGLSKASEAVLLGPFLVWRLLAHSALPHVGWTLIGVGAALVLLNYAALAKAYSAGDLSTVYPVSRGAVLFVLPVLGYLVFDERVGVIAGAGMLLIVIGILLLPLSAFGWASVRNVRVGLFTPATAFALLAAGFTALYTIWDKRAVRTMPLFEYFFGYTVLVAVVYLLVLRLKCTSGQLATEWRTNHRSIVAVGALNSLTYLMVLAALRDGSSSTVIAIRQLSIAWSVLLGVLVLREPLRAPRLVGALLVLAGCGITAINR